jgi:uncharacterized surface protein with fasciclin (FAS1) repeats
MKACLLVSVLAGAHAVPAGKAEIVVTDTSAPSAFYDCGTDTVKSSFQVDQNACYGLAGVNASVINLDQSVHCQANGDFTITTYKSSDGSCTGSRYPDRIVLDYHKDQCIADAFTTKAYQPATVKCPEAPTQNIVELAESVKNLSTLVSAVVAADLVDTLSSPGPFTVFAPTNDAFGSLPAGTLDDLMKPENKGQLTDILTYHVLPGQFLVKDLDLFQPVETVEGKPLHIQKWGDSVQVGPSLTDLKKVTSADNQATNGAVHIIDGVLLPPSSILV